eukprot:TRINITY_DN27360_c0_g1_i1.p1 TRINITY_DN27360_c0_g1~~TRINITY_DN27360_c0_g1_i1.p1  ORF type:complete len:343 (+),score=72.31 TRINITY_DN27360_c0_g1_i1:171-1199(+)
MNAAGLGFARRLGFRTAPAAPLLARVDIGGVRTVIRHPQKSHSLSLGHKLEVVFGPNTKRRHMPPKIPKHPLMDVDQNMNEIITYQDLKQRWSWTTKFGERRMKIARKWKPKVCTYPKPKPTCAFVWHTQMPHRQRMPELPPEHDFPKINTKDAFAVFKSGMIHQHKVTIGDLVQCEKLHRRQAGDKVVFGTVMLVGCKDFTIIGKPTVPYAKVKATVEQQTLAAEMLTYKYKSRRKQQRFLRRRQYVTMLRIDEIVVEPEKDSVDPPVPKADNLLELWANRWLDPVEKSGIEMIPGPDATPVPKVSEIYDGSEHQPGSYHRRGLTNCYRFMPDPQHTHWKL